MSQTLSPVPPGPAEKTGSSVDTAVEAASGWTRRNIAVLAVLGLVVGLHRAERGLPDTDVLWGARSGRDILSTGSLPHADSYSWTAAGRTWIPNSWGWNVVLGLADRLAGVAGILALGVAIAVAVALLIAATARRAGAGPVWTAMVFLVLGPVALFVSPRAQAMSYVPMLALPLLLPLVLFAARRRAFGAAIGMLALQIVWTNLHASAVIGPLLIAVAGAGLLLERRSRDGADRAAIMRWMSISTALVLCCLVTPYGTAPLSHVSAVRSASAGIMQEWLPPGVGSPVQILGLVGTVAGIGATWIAWRARRWDRGLMLAVLVVASCTAIRFAPLVALFAIPELAAGATRLPVRPVMQRRILGAGGAVLALMVVMGAGSLGTLPTITDSPRLVAQIPSHCRVVNDMLVGGAIILRRPDVTVSLDSRNDMYGREGVLASIHLLANDPGAEERMRAESVDCVLALNGYKLVADLSRSAGWRVVGSDGVRTLLVRDTPTP